MRRARQGGRRRRWRESRVACTSWPMLSEVNARFRVRGVWKPPVEEGHFYCTVDDIEGVSDEGMSGVEKLGHYDRSCFGLLREPRPTTVRTYCYFIDCFFSPVSLSIGRRDDGRLLVVVRVPYSRQKLLMSTTYRVFSVRGLMFFPV